MTERRRGVGLSRLLLLVGLLVALAGAYLAGRARLVERLMPARVDVDLPQIDLVSTWPVLLVLIGIAILAVAARRV